MAEERDRDDDLQSWIRRGPNLHGDAAPPSYGRPSPPAAPPPFGSGGQDGRIGGSGGGWAPAPLPWTAPRRPRLWLWSGLAFLLGVLVGVLLTMLLS